MPVDNRKLQHTKTVISALLVSQKGGYTLPELDKDYYEEEGEHIPWRAFGHSTLLGFLQSIPKSVQVTIQNNVLIVRGIPSDKSKHISKFVADQKVQGKKPSHRKTFRPSHYYPMTAPPRLHIPAWVLTAVIDLVSKYQDGLSKEYVLSFVQSYMPTAYISMADMEQQLQQLSHKIVVLDHQIYTVENKPKDIVSSYNDRNLSSTNKQTEQQSQPEANLVQCFPAGSEDFEGEVDFDHEDDFIFLPSGCTWKPAPSQKNATAKKSISSFIQETVSKCHDQRPQNEATNEVTPQDNLHTSYNVDNCSNNDVKHNAEFDSKINYENDHSYDCENIEMLISERVKFRLEKLIQKYPDGIWCADFPDKYLEEYKISLNYMELGFNSVREFASQLPEIFHCVQPHETADFKLYSAKNKTPPDPKKERQKASSLMELYRMLTLEEEADPLPTLASADTCEQLIPGHVMTLRESVGQINVEDLASDEKPYVEVVVVEVFNPSFFWIQLRKRQKVFKKFMEELHIFYTANSEKYTIPPIVLEKGLNCACTYNGKWHRGLIKTVRPDLQVTVLFYDYGTLKTYSAQAIHYLHRSFSHLPAQAIPCGLFNTRPCSGNKWSQGVTHEFAIRTSDIPLIATIASIDAEDNSMMVTLTDTLDDEDVHINDWLVEKRLAIHGIMVRMKSRNYTFQHYTKCKRHLERATEASGSKENELLDRNDSLFIERGKVALHEKTEALRCILRRNSLNRSVKRDVGASERSLSLSPHSERNSSPSRKSTDDVTTFREKLLSLRRSSSSTRGGTSVSQESDESESGSSPSRKNFRGVAEFREKLLSIRRTSNSTRSNISITGNCEEVSRKKGINRRLPLNELPAGNVDNLKKALSKSSFLSPSCDEDLEEDEAINCFRMCSSACKRTHRLDYMNWSKFRASEGHVNTVKPTSRNPEDSNSLESEKRPPITKERTSVKSAESCFLKAVRSSVHFKPLDEHIAWLPTGNVTKSEDTSRVLVRRLKHAAARNRRDTIVAIPQRMLEQLRGKPLSTDDLNLLVMSSSNNYSNTEEKTNELIEVEFFIDDKVPDVNSGHSESVLPSTDTTNDMKVVGDYLHSDEAERKESTESSVPPICPDDAIADTVCTHSDKEQKNEIIQSTIPSVCPNATLADTADEGDIVSTRSNKSEKKGIVETPVPSVCPDVISADTAAEGDALSTHTDKEQKNEIIESTIPSVCPDATLADTADEGNTVSTHSNKSERKEIVETLIPSVCPDVILADTVDEVNALSIHSDKEQKNEIIESTNPSVFADTTVTNSIDGRNTTPIPFDDSERKERTEHSCSQVFTDVAFTDITDRRHTTSICSDGSEKEESTEHLGPPVSTNVTFTDITDRKDTTSICSDGSEKKEKTEHSSPSVSSNAALEDTANEEKSDVHEIAKLGGVTAPAISVPVFNDIDMELDDEEWDVQGDVFSFFRREPHVDSITESWSEAESNNSDERLRIEEVYDTNPYDDVQPMDASQDRDNVIIKDRSDDEEVERITEIKETNSISDAHLSHSRENLVGPSISNSKNTSDEDENSLRNSDELINAIPKAHQDDSESPVESKEIRTNDSHPVDGSDPFDCEDRINASSKDHQNVIEFETEQKEAETVDSHPTSIMTSVDNSLQQDSIHNEERQTVSVPAISETDPRCSPDCTNDQRESSDEPVFSLSGSASNSSAKTALAPYNPKGKSRTLVEMLNKLKKTI